MFWAIFKSSEQAYKDLDFCTKIPPDSPTIFQLLLKNEHMEIWELRILGNYREFYI